MTPTTYWIGWILVLLVIGLMAWRQDVQQSRQLRVLEQIRDSLEVGRRWQ